MTQRFPAEYINGMTIKAFSVTLMITCAFKHLLDCEWFNPRKPIWSEIPFWRTILSLLHSSSPQTFAGNVASFVWGSHPWLSVGLQVHPPPGGAKQQSSLYMAFCFSSPASGLPIQVYKNLTVFTYALLIEGMSVSRVSLYHTAQLDLNGLTSTSWLVWLFWAETVLTIAKLTN